MSANIQLLKNAVSNLAKGSISAVIAVVLPGFLIRHMSEMSFAMWILVLQVCAYIGYLDFGLQTAVGRYVALANEQKDSDKRDSVVSTAFIGLCLASALGLLFISISACVSSHLFPKVPVEFEPAMKWTLLIVGFSLAIGLPASSWNGVFVGLQKFEIPALTAIGTKFLAAAFVAFAAYRHVSLVGLAVIMASVNISSLAVQYWIFRRYAGDIRIKRSLVRSITARELAGYCLGLTVWSLAMVLISGLDVLLVGRLDFKAVGPYSIASTLVAFVAGTQYAIFSVIIPRAAAVQGKGDPEQLGSIVVRSSSLGTSLVTLSALILITYSDPILKLWVGADYVLRTEAVLLPLLLGNAIRLVWVPYANVVVACGQQKHMLVAPLLEGLTNLFASVLLGLRYGAIGVGYGTLIGAIVGSFANFIFSFPRTRVHLRFSVSAFLLKSLLIPVAAAITPIVLVQRLSHQPNSFVTALGLLVSTLLTFIAIQRSWANRAAKTTPIKLQMLGQENAETT